MKSESIKELATALAKAQASIKGALKDSSNPFFKTKYADLSSVVEAIKEPLTTNGLSYVQISHERENAAAIETLIMHSSGEWLSCGVMSVPVNKADAQGYGSSATYCRRYSLSAAFGVAPEDDDGNAATKAKPDPVKAALKAEFPNGDEVEHKAAPGIQKNTDQEVAYAKLPVETIAGLRLEAKAIEGDFYTLGTKPAIERYEKFKKTANQDEIDGLWSFMDSKIRNGMKRFKEAA